MVLPVVGGFLMLSASRCLSWLHQVPFLSMVHEGSLCSTPSPPSTCRRSHGPLVRGRLYPAVVSVCISLLLLDGHRVFVSLLATCVSSLEDCLFRPPVGCSGVELRGRFDVCLVLIPPQSYHR